MVCIVVLGNALESIHEKRDKHQVLIRWCSGVIIQFLTVMAAHDYTDKFEVIDWEIVNHRGRLNKCEVISSRFEVQLKDLEKLQYNLLPFHQFGFILLTSQLASQTMKKQDKTTQEAKSWDSFSRNITDTCK